MRAHTDCSVIATIGIGIWLLIFYCIVSLCVCVWMYLIVFFPFSQFSIMLTLNFVTVSRQVFSFHKKTQQKTNLTCIFRLNFFIFDFCFFLRFLWKYFVIRLSLKKIFRHPVFHHAFCVVTWSVKSWNTWILSWLMPRYWLKKWSTHSQFSFLRWF